MSLNEQYDYYIILFKYFISIKIIIADRGINVKYLLLLDSCNVLFAIV